MTASPKEICREALRERILLQDLPPGAELDEGRIAADFGLSRTPLREIFQVLAGEGYLRLEANRGARVVSLELASLRAFLQTAPLILATAARLAAEVRGGEGLEALKAAQLRFQQALESADDGAAALADHGFHAQVGEMAANPYMLPALNRLLIDQTRLSRGLYSPGTKKERKLVKKAVQQHEALIGAIETGAADQAADLALQHWELSRGHMESFLRPDPLPMAPVAQGAGAA
ncbi:GntR family transcriptional regulator [Mameliella sp.]|uniref:GntR family transcriptional regulator n=1 Tax=Mameliella sp. TaxID=1924940 RepID=UPI003BA96B6F